MRVVFIGVVDFSKHCLKEILKTDAEIVGVLTQSNNKYNADAVDLSGLCAENRINCEYFKRIDDKNTVEWIRALKPDIIFCFGLSQLIPNELLEIPEMGIVGAHPTLLPQNRGRHPIIWTLTLGLKETGLTFFFMDEGADSGPILSQESIAVAKDDDAGSLYEKIKNTASLQIKKFIPDLINKSYHVIKQDENKATYWRKRTREDGVIDFRMSSKTIYNLVRALTPPYPGAELKCYGKVIVVNKVSIIDNQVMIADNAEPGKVLSVTDNGHLIVKTGDGAVCLEDISEPLNVEEGAYIL